MSSQPRVLAVLPHVIPSTVIGVVKPLMALHRQRQIAARFALEYLVTRREVEAADVVVFSRNTEPSLAGAWKNALELGRSVIYELDDDLFELPLNSSAGEYHRSPERLTQLRRYLESADLVRVYSDALRQKVAKFGVNVARVDGSIDWSLVPSKIPRHNGRERVRIVYATSRIGDELATIFLEDVEKLLAVHPGRVELVLWGCRSSTLARNPSVRFLDYVPNYDAFFRRFARSGFDIGLAPLPNDVFHCSKSNNKFREYAACRIAGVYSDMPVYAECVRDGETGLLVENQGGEWFKALVRLVEDEALRSRMQEQAQQYAREHYTLEQACAVWQEHIRLVLAKRRVDSSIPSLGGPDKPSVTIRDETAQAPNMPMVGLQVVRRVARLSRRFVRSVRERGVRGTIDAARWALNDLALLFWNKPND